MKKYLLGKLEDETPDVLNNIGCQRQGRGMLGLLLVAFFAVFLNGTVWADDPLVDGGVYLIKCKKWNDYYLYPNNDFLQVSNSLNKNRYWCAEKVTDPENGEVYYRFRNFDEVVMGISNSSKGIYLKSDITTPPPVEKAIKWGNVDVNDNSFLFKLGSSYAVIPYTYAQSGDNYGWYLSGNDKSVGLKTYTEAGNNGQWSFVRVTPRFDLISPGIDRSAPITEEGSYDIAHGTSQCLLFFGTHLYSVLSSNGTTNKTTYSLNYEYEGTVQGTLPFGTISNNNDKWTITVNSLPNPAVTVVLTCSVTRYQKGAVVVHEDYRFPIVIGQATHITNLSDLGSNGCYFLDCDIEDASGYATTISTFSGVLDGQNHTIKGLNVPLFGTMTNAVVHNVNLENVDINETRNTDNTGAIANIADGASRIYNVGILSGSVGGTGNTGGLVGKLDGTSRVINCFSYADITSGSVKAGIVGYNNYASKYYDLRTMVMNCMFYGDIAEGGTISPVYGGEIISNDYNTSADNRLNNYNYFLYEAPFSKNNAPNQGNTIITAYNCALAAEERFLVRFEFYRHMLNSTRELAAWYATGVADQSVMLKWVLDNGIAPYPILKVQGKYPTLVNYDTTYTYINGVKHERDTITVRNHGGRIKVNGQAQTLKVYVSNSKTNGGQAWPTGAEVEQQYRPGNAGITLYRIDKDTANFNFNYDKVQLPYYNDVGSGNYTENKVVTGWKIISMVGGTGGGYTETNYDYPNYNFADRDHYGKDIYPNSTTNETSGRIYSQGGYFNVPTGVTSITIEPYWGKAAYLSDANYDRYGYNNSDDLTQIGNGPRYTNGTQCPILDGTTGQTNEQKVYTTFSNALATLTGVNNATVYDYAVVLVGNYHHHATLGKSGPELSNGTKPFTIMSVDLNEDNEPDYCLVFRSGKNQQCSPIRYDFITVPGMVMAHKMASHGDLGIPGNCCPKGWFEITTTGLIKFGQFEHSYNGKTLAPVIFMGGVIDQFVANNTGTSNDFVTQTKYMLFGDNVWFKMFSNGCHMDKFYAPPRRPISITGGEYEVFYLSGYFRPDANPPAENAECYVDGGKFGEVAGAGQEHINGNVTWMINHADIDKFFGGGINAAKPITGNISTTINNSWIDYFCGGPMFGDMLKQGTYTITYATNAAGTSTGTTNVTIGSDRTVTTTAANTTFGTYFGAGYGGTAIYREQFYNVYESLNYNEWNAKVNGTYKSGTRGYYASDKGVKSNYNYEFFGGSAGNVHRLYLHYASFSLAKTNNVTSELTGCTVLHNFYGGGSLGAVDGNATSTLTNCTVKGNAFGAGFSVTIPKVDIRELRTNPGPFIPEPFYNTNTGVYEEGGYPDNTQYSWIHVQTLNNNTFALDESTHSIKTTENLDDLGKVIGNATLTIKGNSTVNGNVFGGGDQSGVNGNTTVYLQESSHVFCNVYGGGNEGKVDGDSKVLIQDEPEP